MKDTSISLQEERGVKDHYYDLIVSNLKKGLGKNHYSLHRWRFLLQIGERKLLCGQQHYSHQRRVEGVLWLHFHEGVRKSISMALIFYGKEGQ